jgi:hypothetical protein
MDLPDINHPILGLLRYSDECDCYVGQVKFQNLSIDISVETDEDGVIEPVLEKISHFIDRLENYAEAAKNYAADRLLELKNNTWLDLDNNEQPLTSSKFTASMLLDAIFISWDGSVSFYHQDGNLFWGHWILVEMDVSTQFLHAEIAG